MKRQNEYYKRKRYELIEKREGCCAFCTSREKLEFAHLSLTELSGTGGGRGRNRRVLDAIHHPEAYILLCHQCHLSFDRGDLP